MLTLLEKSELPQVSVGWLMMVLRQRSYMYICNRNGPSYLQITRVSHTIYLPFTTWEIVIPSKNSLLLKIVFDIHDMPTTYLHLLFILKIDIYFNGMQLAVPKLTNTSIANWLTDRVTNNIASKEEQSFQHTPTCAGINFHTWMDKIWTQLHTTYNANKNNNKNKMDHWRPKCNS